MVDFTLEPKKALKRVFQDGKNEGYIFDNDELAEELKKMNKGGAFSDIELDPATLDATFSRGDEDEIVKNISFLTHRQLFDEEGV